MTPTADLLITGGVVRVLDDVGTRVDSLAVTGGKVLAVGDRTDLDALVDPSTRIVNVAGRTVIPGLTDGHAHLDREGLRYLLPSLEGLHSIDSILARIAELAKDAQPGEWIVTMPIGDPPFYRGLPALLAEGRFPTRWELDRAAPDNPVYIRAIWGYWRHELPLVSIANSQALALAGIDRNTVSPWSGIEIERTEDGEVSGRFIEHTPVPTVELTLMSVAPRFTPADRAKALPKSMSIYASAGTTSVYEGHGMADELLDVYRSLTAQGLMSLRAELPISPFWPKSARVDPSAYLRERWKHAAGRGVTHGLVREAGIFLEAHRSEDEAIRATAMPYTGWAGFSADAGVDDHQINEVLLAAARMDMRVCVVTDALLDVLLEVDREVPLARKRWVMGHISTLSTEKIQQIKHLGLVLTTHTNRYLYKQSEALAAELGGERESELVPLRALLDAGVPVCLGTDNVPTSLFHPISHAITRRGMATGRVVGADQRLTRDQAMRLATSGGAYLTFEENQRGTLEPGKFADFAVLSADPWTVPDEALASIHADLTVVDGKIVYSNPALFE